MTRRGRGVAWFLEGACMLALAMTAKVSSDPMPMPEPWAGGRIVPAVGTSVDMVSEDLSATIEPAKVPLRDRYVEERLTYTRCTGRLVVGYVLRSDSAQTVPIVFPHVGEPDAVAMTANGQALRVKVLPDERLFAAYEHQWKQVIDAYIAANPWVREWAAMGTGDAHTVVALSRGLEWQMRLQGLGESAQMAGWGLAHYLVGDWGTWANMQRFAKVRDPNLLGRVRLWIERGIAVAVDPATPDPVALWQGAGDAWNPESGSLQNLLQPPMCRMTFATCSVPLRAGDNRFTVTCRQMVGTVGVRVPVSQGPQYPPGVMGGSANQLSFILRTARFWRSFGKLSVNVSLPAGTRYAACSLPGAQVKTEAGRTTVTYQGEGLPAQNLHVTFAAFQPVPDPDAQRSRRAGTAMAADQARLGTPPSDLADIVTSMPESGVVAASELQLGRGMPLRVRGGMGLIVLGGLVIVAVWYAAIRRRRRSALSA